MWPFSSRQPRTRHVTSQRRDSARLLVEHLERRDTPAVFTVTSALDGLSTVSPTTTPLSQQGDLTLRQAIIDANATPGTNTINFAIPTKGGFNLGGGGGVTGADIPNIPQAASLVQTISLGAPLPTLSDPAIVDGTSQAGWQPGAPTIVLDGSALGTNQNELAVSANGCVIQGLGFTQGVNEPTAAVGLALYSSNNAVYDDTFTNLSTGLNVSGGASNNTIGGSVDAQSNKFSSNTVAISVQGIGTSNNVVQGNIIQGSQSGPIGIQVSGQDNIIGGTTSAAGNTISEVGDGIEVDVAQSAFLATETQATTADVVEGNSIHISAVNGRGVEVLSNGNTIGGIGGAGNTIQGPGNFPNLTSNLGIDLLGANNLIEGNTVTQLDGGIIGELHAANTIGGTVAGAGNTIGLTGTGISLSGPGNVVEGNFVGVNASGANIGNFGDGVLVQAGNTVIGGTAPGAGNIIADNQGVGVDVSQGGTGNAIEGNSIYANTLGGINPDTAVAPKAPVLQANTSKKAGPTSFSQITGTLAGVPGASYRVEFFANLTPPLGDSVQGQTFLGFQNVTIAASGPNAGTGNINFNAPALEQNVTATATDGSNNTSGFSAPVAGPMAIVKLSTISSAAAVPVVSAPQSMTVGQAYSQPLQATVDNASGRPLAGVKVTFTAPATGPSGTFDGKRTVTVITGSDGIATAPALTANTHAGTFAITVKVNGVSEPAKIDLTNLAAAPAKISLVAGKSRTAKPDAALHTPLEVRITDVFGNVISGAAVTFTVQPNTGTASAGTFQGSLTDTVDTNAHGYATAPALKVNGKRGRFTVSVSTAGLADASFDLHIV